MTYPLEQTESENFSAYLTQRGIKHHHGADNMHTRSWNQKRKMKAAGFSKGFLDFCLIIPPNPKCTSGGLLFIEMKRVKGGQVSPEQKEWAAALSDIPGVEAHIAKGCDAAIEIVEGLY